MSYEDCFEREAADQRAYQGFESWYIYENLQPQNIGKREWLLMFERTHSYSTYSEAAREARDMARELGRSVEVQSLYEGCFVVRPDDVHKFPEGSFWSTYPSKRSDFIKALVVEGRYPDLVKIADESNDPNRHRIARHYYDEVDKQHRLWREAASQQAQLGSAA